LPLYKKASLGNTKIRVIKVVKYHQKGKFVKKDLHPELFEITVHCTCGNEIKTRSTRNEIRSTLCSGCHPFYTGQQKYVDTAGRIEKFENRYNKPVGKKKA
jgi:large subunit ribosomal protein L31